MCVLSLTLKGLGYQSNLKWLGGRVVFFAGDAKRYRVLSSCDSDVCNSYKPKRAHLSWPHLDLEHNLLAKEERWLFIQLCLEEKQCMGHGEKSQEGSTCAQDWIWRSNLWVSHHNTSYKKIFCKIRTLFHKFLMKRMGYLDFISFIS